MTTVAVLGDTVTLVLTDARSVTAAVSLTCGSTTLTAFTRTIAGEGRLAGALYSPAASIIPTVASPPAMSFTSHFTALLELFCTLAWNCWVAPRATDAVDGVTLIFRLTVPWNTNTAVSIASGSAVLMALMRSVDGAGVLAGARYRPAALIVPRAALPPGTSLTSHVTC